MINSNLINSIPLNTWNPPSQTLIEKVQINNLWLLNDDYKIYNISDDLEVNLNEFPIPQRNGKGFLSYFKRGRQISISLYVRWVNQDDFIQKIDKLRQECFQENSILYYQKGNFPTRQIKVNCISFPEVHEHYNINFIAVNITFTTLDPFWSELVRQTTNIWSRSINFREEVTNLWTDITLPVIYLIFTEADLTSFSVEVGENIIIIDQILVDGDVVIIDSKNTRVLLNNIEIDYDWVFPEMKKGTNFFDFTFIWTFAVKTLILNDKNYV